MIVPSSRLIVLSLCLVVPAATAAGLSADLAGPAAVVLAGLAAVCAADAWTGRRAAGALEVSAPPQLRLVKDTPATLPITVRNRGARPIAARAGLVLPAAAGNPLAARALNLAPAAELCLDWEIHPARRGDYPVERVYLEAASWFGLWAARASYRVPTVVRVYPDLRNPETLALLRRHDPGLRVHRQVGKGREFEKLREYNPGDSYEDIHWKATARRRFPAVKQYQIEHAQEVYLLVDHSRLASREQAIESYIGAALHLALAAERNKDRFGLLTFTDRVHRFVRAHSGPGHFRVMRETLYDLEPRPVNPDFREVFSAVKTGLRRRSLLLFFTALDDPLVGESFEQVAGPLARQHAVVVCSMYPAAIQPVLEGPAPATLDEAYGALAGQMLWNRLQTLGVALRNRGVRFIPASPDTIRTEAASAYRDIKRRQLL